VDRDAALDRTFEAIVFDWDGTAVPDRQADATGLRSRLEALIARGVHLAVVTGTHVGNIDGQLGARPIGPGTLHLCVNRGSEVFEVGRKHPKLVWRRTATTTENQQLDRAAELAVSRFGALGLTAKVVSQRLNRRKIDIIPEPEWEDPPKARIDELLAAVTARLHAHGIAGLAAAVEIGRATAIEAGLPDPRVTSDAKHVEIGLTDKSDAVAWILARMAAEGIGPGLFLVAGDEFGPLGDATGSDALMLVPEVARAATVSVGVEPQGVPDGVLHLPGGPERFIELLDDQLRRRDERRVPAIDHDPAWIVKLDGDPHRLRVGESLGALANGVIGIRAAREEDGPGTEPLVVASGIYTGRDMPRLLPGPVWPSLMMRPAAAHGRWWLDLRTAVLLRQSGDGRDVRTMRFVSTADPGALALRAEGPSSRLASGEALLAPDTTTPFVLERTGEITEAVTRSTAGGGIAIAAATVERLQRGFRMIERLAAHHSSRATAPRRSTARRRLQRVRDTGFDQLLADHRRAWAQRWDDAEVVIDGDPEAELATRFALFHLLSSAPVRGEAAVGARGLSGPAYGGHVFWDSDVFVLPVLAAVQPAGARAMLEYRLRRLDAARRAAGANGLPGARFPWESAATGEDVTPRLARGRDGSIIPIRTGRSEEHITADVAWAACEYTAWTGDEVFVMHEGRDLVLDTARYWAARVRLDSTGAGHIYGVIGPDEYHEVIDDSAFTNVMARWHLRRAAALAESAGGADPDEVADWRHIAGSIVDGFDPGTGLYEQFAGYWGLEPLRIADFAPPPVAADLLLGAARVEGSQLIKQADVVMLHHLVPDEVAAGSLIPNLDFYGPRTAHGSSLSPAIQAAVLARAGRPDDALELFRLAARLDLDDLTGTTAGGIHLATMGGLWQALAYGFMGLRPGSHALAVDPILPGPWQRLGLRLRFQGRRVHLQAGADRLTVTTDEPVDLVVGPDREPWVAGPGATVIPLKGSPS
jgi:trehalose/maltose hydrolase-like predicted phosphorylase